MPAFALQDTEGVISVSASKRLNFFAPIQFGTYLFAVYARYMNAFYSAQLYDIDRIINFQTPKSLPKNQRLIIFLNLNSAQQFFSGQQHFSDNPHFLRKSEQLFLCQFFFHISKS